MKFHDAHGNVARSLTFTNAMPKFILIVDDEPLLRSFARSILEDHGYAVKEAGSAHDALSLLDDDGIDAVVTDIEMPGGLNGLDLARMIRAMWPSKGLIVMSGRTAAELRLKLYQLRARRGRLAQMSWGTNA